MAVRYDCKIHNHHNGCECPPLATAPSVRSVSTSPPPSLPCPVPGSRWENDDLWKPTSALSIAVANRDSAQAEIDRTAPLLVGRMVKVAAPTVSHVKVRGSLNDMSVKGALSILGTDADGNTVFRADNCFGHFGNGPQVDIAEITEVLSYMYPTYDPDSLYEVNLDIEVLAQDSLTASRLLDDLLREPDPAPPTPSFWMYSEAGDAAVAAEFANVLASTKPSDWKKDNYAFVEALQETVAAAHTPERRTSEVWDTDVRETLHARFAAAYEASDRANDTWV
jgi:hypothetical protein